MMKQQQQQRKFRQQKQKTTTSFEERFIFLFLFFIAILMYSVNIYVLTTREGQLTTITESKKNDFLSLSIQKQHEKKKMKLQQQQKLRKSLEEEYKVDTSKFLIKGITGKEAMDYYFGQQQQQQSNNSTTSTKQIFHDAGIILSNDELLELPTLEQISNLIGNEPKIYGLEQDHCLTFQKSIPSIERNVGCSGMFNSGTNLITRLLKDNCKIPERVALYGTEATKEAHGIRWQVPWGKHTNVKYRKEHATKQASKINKDSVLPIVTIRNPYQWMKSMCKNSYTAKWARHNDKDMCPNIVDPTTNELHSLTVTYADHRQDSHESLIHLWNDWYTEYLISSFPFLMIRFEDLIFHSKNVTTQVCECMGGKIRTDQPFQYIIESAKDGPGHGKIKERTGMVDAWIKYGKQVTISSWTEADRIASKKYLSSQLMNIFGYQHPTS